jgi:hypothetical protein
MTARLSALRDGQPPFTTRKIPGTHFCLRLSRPQSHSAVGRIRSIEKYNDFIGIRTRDHPVCSIVPQSTTLPRAPIGIIFINKYVFITYIVTCRVVRVTKLTGFSSDDWIYLHFNNKLF